MSVASDITGRGALPLRPETSVIGAEGTQSAVSWAAIFAGALAAIVATIILFVLGTGVGLSMISPWYGAGVSATTFGVSAVVGLVVIQWLSSGIGGFLAGRLRTKWVSVHSHEVFFRDTAHGFLAWSLATVAGALMFASVTASGVSGVARGTTDVASAAATGATSSAGQHGGSTENQGSAYFVDTLFRSNNPADGNKADSEAETGRILAKSLQGAQIVLSPADKTYVAQTVAARTGIPQADAEQRVDTVVVQINDASLKARQAADTARKRSAQLSIVGALAMLIGAFIASVSAALGGGIRDEY
jgi:hypothetical protein